MSFKITPLGFPYYFLFLFFLFNHLDQKRNQRVHQKGYQATHQEDFGGRYVRRRHNVCACVLKGNVRRLIDGIPDHRTKDHRNEYAENHSYPLHFTCFLFGRIISRQSARERRNQNVPRNHNEPKRAKHDQIGDMAFKIREPHTKQAHREDSGCDIEKFGFIHLIGNSAKPDIERGARQNGNPEYDTVFNYGEV